MKVDLKEGWISENDVILGFDFVRRCYSIVYKYKAGTKEPLEKSKEIRSSL